MSSEVVFSLSSRTPEEVARAFFGAIEAGDTDRVRSLYADNAVIWHNYTRKVSTAADNLEVLSGFIQRSVSRTYTDRKLRTFDDGFIQQHLLIARAADGYVLELPACLVCKVRDGQITKLEEYFDAGGLAEWFQRTSPASP